MQKRPALLGGSRALPGAVAAFLIALLPAHAASAAASRPGASGASVATPGAPAADLAATPDYRRSGGWVSSRIGGGGYLQHVVFAPSNREVVYLTVDVGGIYRSDDGGLTWNMRHAGLPQEVGGAAVRGAVVDPQNPDIVVVAVGSQWGRALGLYRTENGGRTWARVADGLFYGNEPQRAWGHILHWPTHGSGKRLYAASAGSGFLVSEDSGKTWSKRGDLDRVNPVAMVVDSRNPDRLWLSAHAWKPYNRDRLEGGFFYSADAGRTWARREGDSPITMVQHPRQPDTVLGVFGGTPAIRASSDQGRSWSGWAEGLPDVDRHGDSVSDRRFQSLALGPDFVLTASQRGTRWRRELDGGPWRRVPREHVRQTGEGERWFALYETRFDRLGAALGFIKVHPENPRRWFFTDWYALYRSDDEGANWTMTIDGIEVTVIHAFIPDPKNPDRVFLGMADNGLFVSEDGGRSYQIIPLAADVKAIEISGGPRPRVFATGGKTSGAQNIREIFWADLDQVRGEWTRVEKRGVLPDGEDNRSHSLAANPLRSGEILVGYSGPVGEGRGGVYRSTDNGDTWRWFGQGLPEGRNLITGQPWNTGREVALNARGTAVVSGGDVLFVRAAGASAWSRPASAPSGRIGSVVASATEDGAFYAATDRGLWRSRDEGANWEQVREGAARHLATDPRRAGRVVASLADGIVLSDDGGDTWVRLSDDLPRRHFPYLGLIGQDGIVVGTDGTGAFRADLRDVKP